MCFVSQRALTIGNEQLGDGIGDEHGSIVRFDVPSAHRAEYASLRADSYVGDGTAHIRMTPVTSVVERVRRRSSCYVVPDPT
jgi:hypothetical protein